MNAECSFPVYITMIRKQKPNGCIFNTAQSVMKYFLSADFKSKCSISEICWSERSEHWWPEFNHSWPGAALPSPMILLPKFFSPFLEGPLRTN